MRIRGVGPSSNGGYLIEMRMRTSETISVLEKGLLGITVDTALGSKPGLQTHVALVAEFNVAGNVSGIQHARLGPGGKGHFTS